MPESAFTKLAAAIRRDDPAGVAAVLAGHAELRGQLDQALPGDAFGATPLLAAVHRKNPAVIEALLAAGADINGRSHWWAGSFGVLDGSSGLEDWLIARGARVDAHAAARMGRLDLLELLIAAHPELVHARGGDGQTPLHFAANPAIAEYLLAQGADLDAEDIDHESTPAQWMIRERQPVVRFLVERGCRSDILMAAALGDLELARRHLEPDAGRIRTSVSDRWFPRRNPRSAGTIYQWTLGRDKTAHFIAREFGHEEVYRFLMAESPETLQLAVGCEVGDAALVRQLLARHPDLVSALSAAEVRMLADAARDDNHAGLRLMLEAGWPVDAAGQDGGTALHWAAWRGDLEMVRDLLAQHPPLEHRGNDYHGTPLEWAVYASVHGWHPDQGDYAGTVAVLLQAGAKAPAGGGDLEASDAVREVLRRAR